MPLPRLYGHSEVRSALVSAHHRSRLPQSLLLHGPPGIGKERLGLWLGQLLLCPEPVDGPCGDCRSCQSVLRLEHPDVHWYFPLPRPKAASPEKLREALEDHRAEELAHRREDPLHIPEYDRPTSYFVAAVRSIQRQASMRPSSGSRAVFVVGDVDRMVPQEGSEEAANAFLKLLEEPPAGTTIVLTSSRPGSLLPTIRSRVLPVRARPLHDADVAAFLEEVAEVPTAEAEAVSRLAEGSVSRAVRLRPGRSRANPVEEAAARVRQLMGAVTSDSPGERFRIAHGQSSFGARSDDFAETLDALAVGLRGLLLSSGEAETPAPAGKAAVDIAVEADPRAVSQALERIDRARGLAAGNVNPQLLLAELLGSIHRDLMVGA